MTCFRVLSFIVLLSVLVTLSHSQRCTRNNNNNVVETQNQCETHFGRGYYCDTTNENCVSMRRVSLTGTGNIITNPSQDLCEVGFKPIQNPTGKKCMTMAIIGCNVITANHYTRDGNINCPLNSGFNAAANEDDPGTCVRNANVADVKSEGDFCGYNLAGRNQVCGHNLICGENNICKRRGDVGEECDSHSSGCIHGLLCVNHKCIEPYSLSDGSPCLTNNGQARFDESCESGYCSAAGVCSRTASMLPCWRNVDCSTSANSACVVPESGAGRCLAVYNPARGDWLRCIKRRCSDFTKSHLEMQNCMTTGVWDERDRHDEKCMKEYARYMCAFYCTKNPDERNPLSAGGESFVERGEVPFKFDCERLTVTRLNRNSDCNIQSFFSNCHAIVNYPSSASSLSISVVSIVSSIALSIVFLSYSMIV